ncbi:Uu.00g007780.m01.CDS01 [Anthostomella pinea]|uniref:Uu.00g007780.m01.CDS01 n=1 Tax=Anthostomella pinea TaxID=933095 RepID=A0AAI8VXR2_9PEZI|nr:Uu.00g007780.m01.CDS01 [Anthostomella pinea]
MGCCFSRPEGPNAPYPGGAPSPSARAINSPPLRSSSAEDGSAASQPHRHRVRSQQPLSQHIDKPLCRHEWVARNRAWTRANLDTERADFFDTRVTGKPEIWQVLHTALEIMWAVDANTSAGGEPKHDDGSGGLATAQSILKAAEVTLPTGDLANGAYDSLGNYYALPEWIVCDPVNVAEDSGTRTGNVDGGRRGKEDLAGEDTTEDIDDDDEEEALRRREEKGKGVVDVKNMVKVRARLSENYPDVTINVGPDESVRSMARKIAEKSGLPSTKRIRVAYMGKILKENTSLPSQGWSKGHIVNALVFNR